MLDCRPVFAKRNGVAARMAKIQALALANTPEARKARKAMNVIVVRRGTLNVKGFYKPNAKKA